MAAAQLLRSATAARTWVTTLRQLKQLPADLVVPAHGPAMDKRIIDANERYIAGVYEAVAAAKAAGVGRGELELPPAGSSPTASTSTRSTRPPTATTSLWAWDEV